MQKQTASRLTLCVIVLFLVQCPLAKGQITYDLIPISFTINNSLESRFNGNYTISGEVVTDGSYSTLTNEKTSLYIDLVGPTSHKFTPADAFTFETLANPTFIQAPSLYADARYAYYGSYRIDSSAYTSLEVRSTPSGDGLFAVFTIYSQTGIPPIIAFGRGTAPTINGIFAVNQGPVPGALPTFPILPTQLGRLTDVVACDPCGDFLENIFLFRNMPSGYWFDPPTTDGYEYMMLPESSALFTSILDFPTDFEGEFTVSVDGVALGEFGPGESVDFVTLLGRGVKNFRVTGIAPGVDAEDPNAFPLKLAFSEQFASFAMIPLSIPEPGTGLLALTMALAVATHGGIMRG